MAEESLRFYIHPQSEALSTLLPILKPHLPFSNGLYNRMRAPHNLPSRHCLFAATFAPPSAPGSTANPREDYTILFADRSRHSESQIWIFNPLITKPSPLSAAQQSLLAAHLTTTILFLRETKNPRSSWLAILTHPKNSPVSMSTSLLCYKASRNQEVPSFVQPIGICGTSPPQRSPLPPSNVDLYQQVSPSAESQKINWISYFQHPQSLDSHQPC